MRYNSSTSFARDRSITTLESLKLYIKKIKVNLKMHGIHYLLVLMTMTGFKLAEGSCVEWKIDRIGCEDLYNQPTNEEMTKCFNACSWKPSCSHATFTFGEYINGCKMENGKPDWSERYHGTLYELSKSDCQATMIENHGCLLEKR